MTAVASFPSFQPGPRSTWHATSQGGLNGMAGEDVSRMFMPRKGVQRSNSSSSIASSTSSTSTVTLPPSSSSSSGNEVLQSTPLESTGPGGRKKAARNVWPPAKSDPVSAVASGRSQPAGAHGPSSSATAAAAAAAAAGMAPLHHPVPLLPSQHILQSSHQNGVRGGASSSSAAAPTAATGQPDGHPMLFLLPMNGTFERKTINVPYFPDVLRIGRQTNAKTVPTPHNGYFDSKVLSRQHAEIWADRLGKIWIRDVKSSNGTFVNGQRLSGENRDSDPHELREQDIVELGIDIVSEDQRSVVHHKVAARVEHAGPYAVNDARFMDVTFGDLDPGTAAAGTGGASAQNQGGRGRPVSQGMVSSSSSSSVGGGGGSGSSSRYGSTSGSVAGGNYGYAAPSRHVNYWLTPVTVDQIVKRLSVRMDPYDRLSSVAC